MSSMFDEMNQSLIQRLQAVSYAIPVVEKLQDVADEVYDMDARGCTDREISKHIKDWAKDNGFGFEDWETEMRADLKDTPFLEYLDLRKLWKAYRLDEWMQECVRSIAFTDKPIPFLPFAAGYWIEDPNTDPPTLIAVMTSLSDPKLAAKQLVEKHQKIFGKRASGSPRKDEVDNARMIARHRSGMSYRDIAIQNLRNEYPDIISRPHKYKDKIETERQRVIKAIKAAQELWKERDWDSSTDE